MWIYKIYKNFLCSNMPLWSEGPTRSHVRCVTKFVWMLRPWWITCVPPTRILMLPAPQVRENGEEPASVLLTQSYQHPTQVQGIPILVPPTSIAQPQVLPLMLVPVSQYQPQLFRTGIPWLAPLLVLCPRWEWVWVLLSCLQLSEDTIQGKVWALIILWIIPRVPMLIIHLLEGHNHRSSISRSANSTMSFLFPPKFSTYLW